MQASSHPQHDRRVHPGSGRRRLVVHDNVEMGVERGDLVHLGESEVHLLGQGDEMAGVQAAAMVLQQMEVLDQEIGLAFAVSEQRLHLGQRRRIDLAAFRVIRPAPPPRAGMDPPIVLRMR